MSTLSHLPSRPKKTTHLASGFTPTDFKTYDRGTPAHSAMYDQPSSQAKCVIWVWDGKRFSSASEKLEGRSTRPSTLSRQSTKLAASNSRYATVLGGSPLTGVNFEISL